MQNIDFLKKYIPVEPYQVIKVIRNTLSTIDKRLVEHGERVAYIVHEMFEENGGYENFDYTKLIILSVFHDIGAYKTEEIDRMVEFETKDVWEHSIYGYLFLKNMTPAQRIRRSDIAASP